jgi:hypothetical protein
MIEICHLSHSKMLCFFGYKIRRKKSSSKRVICEIRKAIEINTEEES